MVDNDNTKEATVDHASKETVHAPQHHESYNTRKDNSNQESDKKDVAILPSENFVGLKVFNVFNDFLALVDHYPTHVRPHEAFFHRVWIFFFIGLEMMSSVIAAPLDG